LVPADAIVCAPCLLGKPEGEYLLDPRGLNISFESAVEAAVWIRRTTKALQAA
jgi:hypothetical protein